MSELVRICSKTDLPQAGHAREFQAAGKAICVANVDGSLCAVDNVCPHRGGPLSEGTIEEGKIVCPWHGWEFDPVSGSACHFPQAKVEVYPINIDKDDVYVKV